MTIDLTRPPGGTPPVDVPAMVLLVDDQTIVAEAVRRALVDEDGIDFHYCRVRTTRWPPRSRHGRP